MTDNKKNILIECYEHVPTYDMTLRDFKRYTSLLPINVRGKLTKDIIPEDVSWCDVLIDVRGCNPLSAHLVHEVKKLGRKTVLMLDDDMMEIYNQDTSYDSTVFAKSLRQVLTDVDCLLTSSKYLGEKYKQCYGIEYALVNTTVEDSQFVHADKERELHDIRLLYAANPRQRSAFEEFIVPILGQLYQRYGDKVSLTIIGPNINIEGVGLRVQKYPAMPFDTYRAFMDSHSFDIGLAPLVDSESSRSKYFNKYLEYSTNGVCGIYSNVLPFTLVVRDSINGFLVDNNPDSWYETLCAAIDNPELCQACVNSAHEQILQEHSLKAVATKLFTDMHSILSFKAEQSSKKVARFMYIKYLYFALSRRLISFFKRSN